MSWEMVNINDVCRPKQWKTLSTEKLLKTGYPVYGANGIIGFYNEFTHDVPTLVITCRGATCGAVHITEPKSYVNGNAMALDNISDDIEIKFLYYYLSNRGFKDVISGSAQPQITREGLKNLKIPLPPLATQKRIADILDAADALRRKDQELLKKYDELAQAIFIDMFGDPVKNEKGWEVKKISDIFEVKSGGTPSTKNSKYWASGTIPWIGSNMCKDRIVFVSDNKFITNDGLKNSSAKLIPANTVIVALVGATIGRVGLIKFETSTNQNVAALIPKNHCNTNDIYTFYMMLSNYHKFDELGGDKFKMANLSFIKSLPYLNPPIDLQRKFANVINQITLIQQKSEMNHVSLLFDSLIQKAFKGELVA
jgi:type I restriction enzyme S subunit